MSDFLLGSDGLCLTSSDGINWVEIAGSAPWATVASNSICWNGSIFCAIARIYPDTYAYTSIDGVTWTQRDLPDSTSNWFAISWNGTVFSVTTASGNKAATSTDGITWAARSLPYNEAWSLLTAGGGVFCGVVGGYTNKGMTSADGITWTARTLPSGYRTRLVYGGGLFCTVGSDSSDVWRVWTSPDGISWTARNTGGAALNDLTYGAGVFCGLVSGTNHALTSADGITWTIRTLPATGPWTYVAWNGSIFVASKNDSDYATSPDGITWTARTFPALSQYGLITVGEVNITVSFTATPEIGQLNLIGLDPAFNFHSFSETPLIGTIGLTGLQPKHSNYIFSGYPAAGQIEIEGLQPAIGLGFAEDPSQGFLDWSGQLPQLQTRNILDPPPDFISVRYRCYLTPAGSTTFDIELPISSFQSRLRLNGLSYLSVVLKGADAYADQIIEAADRKMRIFREYLYLDGSINRNLIAAADYENLQIAEGGRSGTTATLSGTGNFVPSNFETITLNNPTYRSINSGKHRYRCEIDSRLRPGDTAQINNDSFTVNEIIYIVDTSTSIMEISE